MKRGAAEVAAITKRPRILVEAEFHVENLERRRRLSAIQQDMLKRAIIRRNSLSRHLPITQTFWSFVDNFLQQGWRFESCTKSIGVNLSGYTNAAWKCFGCLTDAGPYDVRIKRINGDGFKVETLTNYKRDKYKLGTILVEELEVGFRGCCFDCMQKLVRMVPSYESIIAHLHSLLPVMGLVHHVMDWFIPAPTKVCFQCAFNLHQPT